MYIFTVAEIYLKIVKAIDKRISRTINVEVNSAFFSFCEEISGKYQG